MSADRPGFLRPSNLGAASARGFWSGLAAGRFPVRRCLDCGSRYFPPRDLCPDCLGTSLEWVDAEPRGTLHSWTEVHMSSADFDTPFLLGLVDLDGDLGRLTAPIEGARAEDLRIGMPVRLLCEAVPGDGSTAAFGLCRIRTGESEATRAGRAAEAEPPPSGERA